MFVFAYGVGAYVAFVLTALYTIGFLENSIVARTIDHAVVTERWFDALLSNTILIGLFALQHTLMGRPVFRDAWERTLPPALERSTRVLVSSDWGLVELRPSRLSREEIFLQLTTDEAKSAAPDAAA